jgi:hypothetical protein
MSRALSTAAAGGPTTGISPTPVVVANLTVLPAPPSHAVDPGKPSVNGVAQRFFGAGAWLVLSFLAQDDPPLGATIGAAADVSRPLTWAEPRSPFYE